SALIDELLTNCDVIVNTTSVGMHPNIEECPIAEGTSFNKNQTVFDVIYNPSETKLLRLARESGCKTINGSGMLFWQGVMAYETWLGISVPEEMAAALYADFIAHLNS
ncbi:MAG: shikimate dehydrogenase, partial [Clostridiales bacterium]|nr:shikimate dehydrogenase [Clostridiales bacterium]